MRNSLWICSILSLFSVFSPFSEPIFSMKVAYSCRALNSTSNDIVILFLEWILVLGMEWSKTRDCFWICCISSFFSRFSPFYESICFIVITFSYRALNSTSNGIVILFFQCILVLEIEWLKTRDCFWIMCISSFFSLFFPFYGSICFIKSTYSYRALISTSNDVFNHFFQLILILEKAPHIWQIVFEYITFHLSFLFSPHFMNQRSSLQLHFLIEHSILHRKMYSTKFSNRF